MKTLSKLEFSSHVSEMCVVVCCCGHLAAYNVHKCDEIIRMFVTWQLHVNFLFFFTFIVALSLVSGGVRCDAVVEHKYC